MVFSVKDFHCLSGLASTTRLLANTHATLLAPRPGGLFAVLLHLDQPTCLLRCRHQRFPGRIILRQPRKQLLDLAIR